LVFYRTVPFQPDLPARARFQALEGLHGYEHRHEDEETRQRHQTRRKEILEHAKARLDEADAKYLREQWGTRPLDNLERRIRDLMAQLSEAPDGLSSLAQTELAQMHAGESIEVVIRIVRNDLAHGTRNYERRLLRPFNDALDRVCRAHLLRLLGCSDELVGRALVDA